MSDSPIARRACKVSDEELVAAAAKAQHMRELLQSLGIAPYGGNYESIRRRLAVLGEVPEQYLPRRSRPGALRFAASESALAEAVAGARTKADVLRALGYEADPRLYRQLDRAIHAAGIDTGHLIKAVWSRGLSLAPRKPLEEVL